MVEPEAAMRKRVPGARTGRRWVWLAVLAAGWAGPACAVGTIAFDRLRAEGLVLEDVRLHGSGAGGALERLELRIGSVQAAWGRIDGLRWPCALDRPEPGVVRCLGRVDWKGGQGGRLELRRGDGWALGWRHGEQRLELHADLALRAVDAVWKAWPVADLQRMLPTPLPEGLELEGGRHGGQARIDLATQGFAAELGVEGLEADSPDGRLAAAGVSVSLSLEGKAGTGGWLHGETRLARGEFLYQPFYVAVATGTRLAFRVADGPRGWQLDGPLRLEDPEGARFELSADAAGRIALRARMPDLAVQGPRYLGGALAAFGFGEPAFAGALDAGLTLQDGRLQRVDLEAAELSFADPYGIVVLARLSGNAHWGAAGRVPATDLGWQALSIQGIALGPARLRGEVVDGRLHALEPLAFAPFGGSVRLHPLWIDPRAAAAGFDAEVRDVDLAALSAQLGLPEFQGRLSGRLPRARYEDGILRAEGQLVIEVFGGRIEVAGLSWERPFGVSPSLSADVTIEDLDLEPLTGAFGFGTITGRLDGYVRGLRVLDGSPVAFDAFLHTDESWKGRRRISQKALDGIGSVGGSLGGGLQAGLLSIFDRFGYRRIGLRCRLLDNVCHMGGIEDLPEGYVLVEGAGLPRVSIHGYRRQVDWPVLLERLKAAAAGGKVTVR